MLSAAVVVMLAAIPMVQQLPSYSGTYQAPNNTGGMITLTLQQQGRRLAGTLSGNGVAFTVDAQVGDEGAFTGTVRSDAGTMFVGGELDGADLVVLLAELGPDNQPNLSAARQLQMRRVSAGAMAGSAPAPAGPTGAVPPGARGGGAGGDPYAGTFTGAELSITLRRSGQVYEGQATYQGNTYPVRAQAAGEGRLEGVYTADGQQYAFEAVVQGDRMQLATGTQVFQLQRGAAGGSPLGGAGGMPAVGLATTRRDEQLLRLLQSSAWCYLAYSQAMGATTTERVTFSADGWMVQSSNRETNTSNQYGQVYGNSGGGDRARYRVENGTLMLSADGTNWQPLPLQLSRNSSGYPIITANGREYSQCN